MIWSPVLNLKPSPEWFEQIMKVKMIIERIIKALLNSKVLSSFELIYIHGLVHGQVSGITILSMFLLTRPESLLLAGLTNSLVLKKCFCFCQEICFCVSSNGACTF